MKAARGRRELKALAPLGSDTSPTIPFCSASVALIKCDLANGSEIRHTAVRALKAETTDPSRGHPLATTVPALHRADAQSAMNSPLPTPVARGGGTREVYAVDGVRLVMHPNGEWECPCKALVPGPCAHIEQAQVYRQLRGATLNEKTVQVQLSAREREAFNAALTEHTDALSSAAVTAPKRSLPHSLWPVVLAAASVVGLASGIAYIPTTPSQPPAAAKPLRVAVATPTPKPPSIPAVKFVNPFDATEVFEFPAGTSQGAAHDAVAELLLNRARTRLR